MFTDTSNQNSGHRHRVWGYALFAFDSVFERLRADFQNVTLNKQSPHRDRLVTPGSGALGEFA